MWISPSGGPLGVFRELHRLYCGNAGAPEFQDHGRVAATTAMARALTHRQTFRRASVELQQVRSFLREAASLCAVNISKDAAQWPAGIATDAHFMAVFDAEAPFWRIHHAPKTLAQVMGLPEVPPPPRAAVRAAAAAAACASSAACRARRRGRGEEEGGGLSTVWT